MGDPGALAIDPVSTNIVYVGTTSREGSQFSGEATQPPAGLFKSTDSGASWIRLGLGYPAGPPSNASIFFSQLITVVIVDPANPQTLYIASNAGLFVSTDGGHNWTKGVSLAGDVRSLSLDTTSPASARILYAGVSGVGVVQSTDGGLNWTTILNAATPAVSAALAGPAGFGKVVVALAPAAHGAREIPPASRCSTRRWSETGTAPNTVGLFQSTDQGNTWSARAATGLAGIIASPQGGYSFLMAVDPQSPGDGTGDIIYFGNQFQARSTDAGNNFGALGGLHADTHAWAFSPQPGPFSVAYCGNDGGFFNCASGTTFTSLNAGGIQTALFYNLDVKRDATASVTARRSPGQQHRQHGGRTSSDLEDGHPAMASCRRRARPGQTRRASTAGSTRRSSVRTDDGDSAVNITPPWPASEGGTYLAAVATDPNAAGGVYVSSKLNLWRSTDGEATWPNKAPVPEPPTTSTWRQPTATIWLSPLGQRCWSRRMRSGLSR